MDQIQLSSAMGKESVENAGEWMLVPLPDRVPEDASIWHYTTADGLLGIIRDRCLWASSPQSLNDLSEVRHGLDTLQAVWGDLQTEGIPEPCIEFVNFVLDYDFLSQSGSYIASASGEADLVNQWNHYAGGDGFAIKFNPKVSLKTKGGGKQPESVSTRSASGWPIQGWRKVIYDPEGQREAIRKILFLIVNMTPGDFKTWKKYKHMWKSMSIPARLFLEEIILQLKHPTFKDEREIRYIAHLKHNRCPRFRVVGGRLVPFVVAKENYANATKDENPEPFILEVMLGPSVSFGTETSVRQLLDSHGFSDVKVTKSSTPLRGDR